MNMWTVTRQNQWPEGTLCVEISKGDSNYTNPGQLVEKYPGEGQEYQNPVEAVEAGIAIANAWRKDVYSGPKEDRQQVFIAVGNTGGMTMPFEGEPVSKATCEKLREWAAEEWESVEKCQHCGEPIGKRYVYLHHDEDFKFCDSMCAENYEEAWAKECAEDEEEELEEVEDE
jgi:hypothetical protein